MTITSTHNDRLKEIRKLTRRRARERSGRFVAEGEDLLAAADAAGWVAIERFCVEGSGLPGLAVQASALAAASGLGSGTRTLAVYEERWAPEPAGPVCVYLHGIRDPGNVGAVLRSAQAFGAGCVALGPDCADPFGPKAVRASMGAVFGVPVVRASDPGRLPGTRIALVAGEGVPIARFVQGRSEEQASFPPLPGERPPDEPWASTLMIGAERDGLPQEILETADIVAHIPIRTHSLNAAMAATVGLYEIATNRMAVE